LNADASFVAISGCGIISGYTDDEEKNDLATIPKLYKRLGVSFGNYLEKYMPQEFEWDFTKQQPDIIVINLGSNDSSYTKSDEDKCKEFAYAYVKFIKAIRENNPDSVILCTLGMVSIDLTAYMEYAITWYANATEDDKMFTMQYDAHTLLDGYAADWHPSEKTHDKAAQKLTTKIKEIMGW